MYWLIEHYAGWAEALGGNTGVRFEWHLKFHKALCSTSFMVLTRLDYELVILGAAFSLSWFGSIRAVAYDVCRNRAQESFTPVLRRDACGQHWQQFIDGL